MFGYYVANANEYLVITGMGIKKKFLIEKKFFVWPFQNCNIFTVTPLNYEVEISALSHEKLGIKIQASLTIGPNIEQKEAMERYVELLVNGDDPARQEKMIRDRVTGIIEGEMRSVAANMAIEEIFNDRKHFQGKVTEFIQESLNKFGCVLYNANVEELVDSAKYFETMGQKAQEAAISTAKVAVADSKMQGEIGAQDRISKSQKETARLKAETTVFENERQQLVAQSNSELAVKEAQFDALVKIAQIEGQKSAQLKEAELQKEVELKRAAVETERLRAEEYAKAVVESDKIKALADAKAYEKQKIAEAVLYETQKYAEGRIYQVEKEASGIKMMFNAQAEGLREIIKAAGSSQTALQFLMLERGLYQQLAQENAKAIQGLQPKFNIWTTGANTNSDPAKPVRDIFQTLPPLLTTIQQQTGMQAAELASPKKGKAAAIVA